MTYKISIHHDRKIAHWWKNYLIKIAGHSPQKKRIDKDLIKYHAKLESGGIIVFDTQEDYVMFILKWC